MKVYVQWTLTTPTDWAEINVSPEHNGWAQLPVKPEPDGTEVLDNEPGWVFDVCIQGVQFYGYDHVAIEPIAKPLSGVRVYGWSDDVTDPDPQQQDYRWGSVWEFFDPAPDSRAKGRINTRQRKTIYTEHVEDYHRGQETSIGPVAVRPWSAWPDPDPSLVRHGVWVRDETLWRAHFDVRSLHGWEEWA